jgi:hypothetical protein
MDVLGSYLIKEILDALAEGNAFKFLGYLVVFLVLWLEVRGLKKAVRNLGGTISKSFADGEKRFDTLEHQNKDFEHRMTVIEQLLNP